MHWNLLASVGVAHWATSVKMSLMSTGNVFGSAHLDAETGDPTPAPRLHAIGHHPQSCCIGNDVQQAKALESWGRTAVLSPDTTTLRGTLLQTVSRVWHTVLGRLSCFETPNLCGSLLQAMYYSFSTWGPNDISGRSSANEPESRCRARNAGRRPWKKQVRETRGDTNTKTQTTAPAASSGTTNCILPAPRGAGR